MADARRLPSAARTSRHGNVRRPDAFSQILPIASKLPDIPGRINTKVVAPIRIRVWKYPSEPYRNRRCASTPWSGRRFTSSYATRNAPLVAGSSLWTTWITLTGRFKIELIVDTIPCYSTDRASHLARVPIVFPLQNSRSKGRAIRIPLATQVETTGASTAERMIGICCG